MRAVVQRRYGSPGDLEGRDVDRPSPGPSEVLVRVRATSVHPDVWHVVRGRPAVLRLMGAGPRRPAQPIPGTDLAGEVVAVGADVDAYEPGDPVFGEVLGGFSWANGGPSRSTPPHRRPDWPACRMGSNPSRPPPCRRGHHRVPLRQHPRRRRAG